MLEEHHVTSTVFFFSKVIFVGFLWVGTGKFEHLTWENDSLKNEVSNIKIQSSFLAPEEMNSNHGKKLHTTMMDSGFTVFGNGAGYESCFYPIAYMHLINNVCDNVVIYPLGSHKNS
jgi:thiazole synthase ThiGH ThiG subunit